MNTKKEFFSYGAIGLLNTVVHFVVFYLLSAGISQAWSNLSGFLVAVTVSFFLNAKFTFNKKPSPSRYSKMLLVMGALAYGSGFIGDVFSIWPIITFISYCVLSYVIGFLLSKYFVFK